MTRMCRRYRAPGSDVCRWFRRWFSVSTSRGESLLTRENTMARIDTSRRQQLVAHLKSAVGTAALVATLGGWIAFGTREPATITGVTAAVPTTVPVVVEASTSNNTTVSVNQSDQNNSAATATVAAP